MRSWALVVLALATLASVSAAALTGTLYVSNLGSGGVISKHDAATGALIDADFIVTPGGSHGILQVGNEVLVAVWATDQVRRYSAETGAFLGVFADATSSLNDPVDLRVGPDGMLWVTSQANGRVNRYDLLTGVAQVPFIAAEAHLSSPSGIAFSPDGSRVFVVDRNDGEVLEYNRNSGAYVQTTADLSGEAFGLQWAWDGFLYVGNGGLRRLDPDAPFIDTLVTPSTLTIGVELAEGDIFAAEFSNNAVRRFDPEANASDLHVSGASLNQPNFFHFAVPEPSAIALLFLASLPVMTRRRSRTSANPRR